MNALVKRMDDVPPDEEPIGGDIPPVTWDGRPIACADCRYASLREAGRCEPGRTCLQDRYARRIDRFFRRNPEFGTDELDHPYFEVRAIAVRSADLFHVARLIDDPDETVRHSVAMRVPQGLLLRMVYDPHREVRIRVAYRLEPESLPLMRHDPDYHVRTVAARRMPAALLGQMVDDPDDAVRREVARRIDVPGLFRLLHDDSVMVRRVVAQRLPAAMLERLAGDADWSVRWEVIQRAGPELLAQMAGDVDVELRRAAMERLHAITASAGEHHG